MTVTTFVDRNTGVSRKIPSVAMNEIQRNSKLAIRRNRVSVGRTVLTEERGRRNVGYVAQVGQYVGRLMPEADGLTTWRVGGPTQRNRRDWP